ncbi:MAG: homoserine dehydrogenase [Thermomicrobiales bacterium]
MNGQATRVSLVQVGIGTVGGELVGQALANRAMWRERFGIDLRMAAIAGRGGALAEEPGRELPEAVLRRAVDARRGGTGLHEAAGGHALVPAAEAVARLANEDLTIVLDAAAGSDTAPMLARALGSRAGVVLSNKAPLALPLSNPIAAELWAESGPHGHMRYEATCGAGLPVISTLQTLLATGDEIIEIQGALSGTLGAIFSMVAAGQSFSAAVRKAKDLGYTEPDPRDDLSGLDVARKALILARTMGREIDLADIAIESLVPDHLTGVSIPEFLDRAADLDDAIEARAAAANSHGAALKYVATVPAAGPISVGLREAPKSGVLGALQGPENIVSFRTARYDAYPLTVAGPGAGAAVTAAGMLGDALALAASMAR